MENRELFEDLELPVLFSYTTGPARNVLIKLKPRYFKYQILGNIYMYLPH